MMFKRYVSNYKSIIRLGLPIVVGQAGIIVVAFADSIMVGRYSTDALSAASFVNSIFNLAAMTSMGFAYGITPLVGALFGQDNHQRIGSVMRNAMGLNFLYTLLLMSIMGILYFNLHRLGQPPQLLPLIRPYFLLYLAGLLPIMIFNVWAQCSYGMKSTKMPMWIVLGGNVLNIVGNYVLIYGHWGFPEMGLVGAGVSTIVARSACALAIVLIFMFGHRYQRLRQGYKSGARKLQTARTIFKTSMPISMQLFMETAAFSGAAIFVGWLGAVELAAFQIILTISTLGFCFYYSLGAATSVLVANAAGVGDYAKMRRIGWAGYHLTLVLAMVASLALVFLGKPLIGLFTTDTTVIACAMSLIAPVVAYQLGDATQTNFANALRGTSKVMPMLWIAFVSYLAVGLPATYIFAFPCGWGIQGVISSFSVSLFLAGGLFLYFFFKYTRKNE